MRSGESLPSLRADVHLSVLRPKRHRWALQRQVLPLIDGPLRRRSKLLLRWLLRELLCARDLCLPDGKREHLRRAWASNCSRSDKAKCDAAVLARVVRATQIFLD